MLHLNRRIVMNNPEDYLKSLLMQEDCEEAMDTIMNRYFEDQDDGGKGVLLESGTYYIIDPFPFLLFKDENVISDKVIRYCQVALEDYKKYGNQYISVGFLPPYIKDTYQNTVFTTITRAFIRSRDQKDIDKMKAQPLVDFYKLIDKSVSKKDDSVYTNFKSWNALKSAIEKSPVNRIVVPRDMGEGGSYDTLHNNKGNVFCVSDVNINYDGSVVPAMDFLTNAAEEYLHKKEHIDAKNSKAPTSFEQYISYMIAYLSLNVEAAKEDADNVKSKKSSRSNADKLKSKQRNLDLSNYKNTRLTPQDSNIEYWKDSAAGEAFKDLDTNLSSSINKEEWAKVKDDLSHTFDRKKVDADLEKVYNLKHFVPDVLGLEPDGQRYDARTYEDPTRKKIKGVSGYDVFKHEKEIDKLEKENDELRDKIAMESSDSKIKKYQKQIEDNEEEIDIIKQEMKNRESNENDLRLHKKYVDKVTKANQEGNTADAEELLKAACYVEEKTANINSIHRYLVGR